MDERSSAFQQGVLAVQAGDEAEAERWFRQAAEAGHVTAAFNVGAFLERRGESAEAHEWFLKAAEGGHPTAAFNVAMELGPKGDIENAERWLRVAAEGGDLDAAVRLGLLLEDRNEVGEATLWYRRAAEGSTEDEAWPYGAHHLGRVLVEEGEVDEGTSWLQRAAEAGNAVAALELGQLYRDQNSLDLAMEWYRRAAEANDPAASPKAAHSLLGLLKAMGRDWHGAEASKWYRQAEPLTREWMRRIAEGNLRPGQNPWDHPVGEPLPEFKTWVEHLGARRNPWARWDITARQRAASERETESKSSCFVATAIYGTQNPDALAVLQRYRDEVLLKKLFGTSVVRGYYEVGPILACACARSPRLRRLIRRICVDPAVKHAARQLDRMGARSHATDSLEG